MKALLLACFVVLFLVSPAHAARPTGPCTGHVYRITPEMGSHITRQHVRNLIGCATDHWPVYGGEGMALCIAQRESHLDPHAYNASSGASGIFQHLRRYWDGRARAFLRRDWFPNSAWTPSPFKARANVLVSIRMAHAGGGWGPWGGSC